MTAERYMLKAFRENWFIFDDKLDLYAGFNSYEKTIDVLTSLLIEFDKLAFGQESKIHGKLKWANYQELLSQ